MDEFFEVWSVASKAYGLSRYIYIDFEEAYMRIYQGEIIIVRVEGTYDDLDTLYITAALRLLSWMHIRGEA